MEPQLRKLGLHTSLKKGIVTLDTDFLVCKKGDKLTADQARLLVIISFFFLLINNLTNLFFNNYIKCIFYLETI
jgi:hypothetical protein